MLHYYSIKYKYNLDYGNFNYISDNKVCRLVIHDDSCANSKLSFFNFEAHNCTHSNLYTLEDTMKELGTTIVSIDELTISEFSSIIDRECSRRKVIGELQK